MSIKLEELKTFIINSMEREKEMCEDCLQNKNHEWFVGQHTGAYEAYERILKYINTIK